MAKNEEFSQGYNLDLPVAAGVVSGAPVVVGQIPGVALTDRRADGKASVKTRGVFTLAVTGNNGVAAAVTEGMIVYMNAGVLNINNAGVRFGYALDPVASGATATIRVKVGY